MCSIHWLFVCRWILPSIGSPDVGAPSSCLRTVSMPLCSTTPSQRYETAMSVLRPVASVLSQLCESDLHCAMKWLYAIEKQVRYGDWKQSMQFADGGTHSDTDDDDSPIQSPIYA